VTTLGAGRGFDVDLSHVTVAGICRDCRARLDEAHLD
jgi:hypothetical protein